jgi:hypothetical protein
MAKAIHFRKIPIRTVVDGVEVEGEIVSLHKNDISVVITSPVTGLGTGLHVPHFAMDQQNWLATSDGGPLTERGQRKAEELLRELYEHSRGNGSGWGISVVGPGGWTPVEPS